MVDIEILTFKVCFSTQYSHIIAVLVILVELRIKSGRTFEFVLLVFLFFKTKSAYFRSEYPRNELK